jgi:hypothetical protein
MYMYYVQRFHEGVECNTTSLDWNRDRNHTTEAARVDVCTCDADSLNKFCTYIDSFHNVFGYLAGGPDDTKDVLDIFCGVVVVIIFLNVVIGIVSNAW